MRPAVLATGNMRHIHGPAFVTATGSTDPALYTRTWGGDALMHEPALLFQHPIDGFAIHHNPILASQQHPQSAIAKRGMLLDQLPQPLDPRRIGHPAPRWSRSRPMQPGSAHSQHATPSPFRDTRQRDSHASDVFRSKG